MSADQYLWVNDGLAQKFLKFDLSGNLLYSWGTFGGEPGQMWGVHGFSVDDEGNLYTASVLGRACAEVPAPARGEPRPSYPVRRVGPIPARQWA